jgi:hypothetical protein
VRDGGARAREEAIELPVVRRVRQQVDEVTGVGRREAGAVALREAPLPCCGEVDVREEPCQVVSARVLANAVVRLLVGAARDRSRRTALVAAVHLGVVEIE